MLQSIAGIIVYFILDSLIWNRGVQKVKQDSFFVQLAYNQNARISFKIKFREMACQPVK